MPEYSNTKVCTHPINSLKRLNGIICNATITYHSITFGIYHTISSPKLDTTFWITYRHSLACQNKNVHRLGKQQYMIGLAAPASDDTEKGKSKRSLGPAVPGFRPKLGQCQVERANQYSNLHISILYMHVLCAWWIVDLALVDSSIRPWLNQNINIHMTKIKRLIQSRLDGLDFGANYEYRRRDSHTARKKISLETFNVYFVLWK